MSLPPATDGSPVRLRATNADRDHVALLIDTAVADGSLTPDEGEQRVRSVRDAVHRDEFDALLADLPVAQRESQAAAAVAPRAALGGLRSLVARHRTLSIIIAVVVVLALLGAGVAAGLDLFGGGGHDGRAGVGHHHSR